MLKDTYGRTITNLRISVTDRCNFRCVYCMPKEPQWLPHKEILSFEEIARLVNIFVKLGINKIRLTGGEPTARHDIIKLVEMVSSIDGVADFSMTTNGAMLKKLARPLWDAGLRRINVSLDTLDSEKFIHITRRDGLKDVIEGLEAAEQVGFSPIKINVVAIRGENDGEIESFAKLARTKPYQIRFIEFMPLEGDDFWSMDKVVPAEEIIEKISSVCPVVSAGNSPAEPAKLYKFTDGIGDIGVIASVTEPFCEFCNRIRLTAEGKLRTCLFSLKENETDLKYLLRNGTDDKMIADTITKAVWHKEEGHLINTPYFKKPERAMYSIGG
ncbi:GTP 3',8-cyclase MoaA [Candidatus Peregrinibacteria bacterium]|nr:GTP 3',8-cyclase MoaA [Candidatus Peregrinibacteria bacterium]